MLGINSSDISQNLKEYYKVDDEDDDISASNFESEAEYEETLANHIDYLIGTIVKSDPKSNLYQHSIARALATSGSLLEIRKELINLIVRYQIVNVGAKEIIVEDL